MPRLGDRIHAHRWPALGVGFAGVIVIAGPQLAAGGGNALGAGIGLGAAVSAAFAIMFLRRMSSHEHAFTITFYFFLTSTLFAGATGALGGWPAPTAQQWLMIGLTGLFGVFGQLLMTYSYHYAEASLVAPLDYVGLLIAVAIGFYLFDEIPHVATWVGAPLVIVAGLIILWREYAKLRSIRSVPRLAP
jgi:drug/metabolite transporter (DMT)-like permease